MHHQQIITVFLFLSCLQQTVTGSVIVNGNKVPDGIMSYMASLQNSIGQHVCGGFLVSEQFVLTAAHCLADQPVRVVLGNHNLKNAKNNGQIIEIEKKIKHPDYVAVANGDDLMLLKLKKRVVLGNDVEIIKLPPKKMEIKPDEMCQVAGWGATYSFGPNANELRATNVSIINMTTCKDSWRNLLILPKNVICAGGYSTKKGFCQGDSGGPLVCNNTAVGIVSFNSDRNCNYEDQVPNVYVNISQFLEWICCTIMSN